jgi:hypothetical protein
MRQYHGCAYGLPRAARVRVLPLRDAIAGAKEVDTLKQQGITHILNMVFPGNCFCTRLHHMRPGALCPETSPSGLTRAGWAHALRPPARRWKGQMLLPRAFHVQDGHSEGRARPRSHPILPGDVPFHSCRAHRRCPPQLPQLSEDISAPRPHAAPRRTKAAPSRQGACWSIASRGFRALHQRFWHT